MTGAPLDPWATESGGSDPLEEGRQLLDGLGDIHRREEWGRSFLALDRLDDREKTCILIAAMFERARALDAEDRGRRSDERWMRRRRLARAVRASWWAFGLEWRRGR